MNDIVFLKITIFLLFFLLLCHSIFISMVSKRILKLKQQLSKQQDQIIDLLDQDMATTLSFNEIYNILESIENKKV